MFSRIKSVKSGTNTYHYLQLVENERKKGKVKQKVLHSLGRIDDLSEEHINGMIESLARFSKTMKIFRCDRDEMKKIWDKELGSVLVFRRLWEESGLDEIIRRELKNRGYGFDVEAAVFGIALQRLLEPGSDLKGSKWIKDIYYSSFENLELQHFYRAVSFLEEKKERIEEELFFKGREVFDYELSLVFYDTTSLYFEGKGPEGLAKYGKTKDHRSDRRQVVVGVIIDKHGNPICCETWRGNITDVETIEKIIGTMKKRFNIGEVILVCDRGMISKGNIEKLEGNGIKYIIGTKMSGQKEVKERVLSRGGRYQKVEDNLEVKEVFVGDRRYVVCYNPDEAEKDRLSREVIVKKLEEKLSSGEAKSLVGNRGYRKYVKMPKGNISIDIEKTKEEKRYDGKFVLRTNTDLSTSEIAIQYKRLWQIESLFRGMKDIIEQRPIFHSKKENVKGHIFGGFLSLFLKTQLQKKLEKTNKKIPWDDIIRVLKNIKITKIQIKDDQYLLRNELHSTSLDVFRAVGLKSPPLCQKL